VIAPFVNYKVGREAALLCCSVERESHSRYALEVHRSNTSRWLIVALLLCRLVLGEFAHALPVHAASPTSAGTAALIHHCFGHDQSSELDTDAVTKHAHSEGTNHSQCCKSGACECPCLHTPALAVASSISAASNLCDDNAIERAIPPQNHRAVNLFRPPIR
jgi:hypothetical protein